MLKSPMDRLYPLLKKISSNRNNSRLEESDGASIDMLTVHTIDTRGEITHQILGGHDDYEVRRQSYRRNEKNDVIHDHINANEIDFSKLLITRYYKNRKIEYVGLKNYNRARTLRLDYLSLLLGIGSAQTAESFFNSRNLTQSQRFELLSTVLDAQYRTGETTSIDEVLTELYGSQVFDNPNYDLLHQRLSSTFQLIVDIDYLSKSDEEYRVTGVGMKAIDEFSAASRRHKDIKISQWVVIGLTLVLAVTAILQIALASFGYIK